MPSHKSTLPSGLCICRGIECKIPFGLCHCGCGGTVATALKSSSGYGYVRGFPVKYISGHNRKSSNPMGILGDALPFKLDGVYCRLVPLNKGYYAIVNQDDFNLVRGHKWRVDWGKNPQSFYAVTAVRGSDGKQRPVFMHRMILGLEPGDKRQGDHANHDTLDNRRGSNLTIATWEQQQQNRRSRRNRYGLKGIHLDRTRNRIVAGIMANKKHYFLGYFPPDQPEKAHAAYCEASRRLHGKYGRTL